MWYLEPEVKIDEYKEVLYTHKMLSKGEGEDEDIPTRTVPGPVKPLFYGATDAQEGLQGG